MMTAREFVAQRHELPDGGRWTELVQGKPHSMHPPDQKHGDVVLNISRKVAESLIPARPTHAGFDIGVQTRTDPDTVRFPAVSVFTGGERFAPIDAMLAEECPALVMEIVSTNDRRTTIAERVYEYHRAGIKKVWVIDPHDEQVTVLRESARPLTFSQHERLIDVGLLPGFEVAARELFLEPSWWRG